MADAGVEVTLYEAKNRLGGRAYSFADPATGLVIDNCQHVILGCCKAAIGFLSRIGSIDHVSFLESTTLLTASGKKLTISASALPPPIHLLPSMLQSNYLSFGDKAALGRVIAKIARRAPDEDSSVSQYLESLKCPRTVADLVFKPITIAVLNEESELASAKYARMAVMASMLGERDGFRMGVPRMPLADVIANPAERYLRTRGCEVRLSCRVDRINVGADGVDSLVLRNGETARADAYVVAAPPYALEDMGLPTDADAMLWRPIISAHLMFDGETSEFGCACVADEPFGWVFNKTVDSDDGSHYVQAVASAAGAIAGLSKDDLTRLALRAVRVAMPESDMWKLKRSVICRQGRATFSTSSGFDRLRPGQKTQIGNLFLAGDWTATGWPSTIESAALSGLSAAGAVIECMSGK